MEHLLYVNEVSSFHDRPVQKGRVPLACLPFAGSGASFYRAWRRLPAVAVEVIPLQLPGREERFSEPLPTDLITTAKELAKDVVQASGGNRPVAVLGHSLGAVLGFEVVREIEATCPGLVCHLFVSGSPGPWTGRTVRATGLDDRDFLARVSEFAGYRHEAFDNPDLREILLSVLRADVAMHENYRSVSDEPVAVPITALRGTDDQLVSRAEVEQWSAATSALFTLVELAGGHMYLTDIPSALLELVGRTLAEHHNEDGHACD